MAGKTWEQNFQAELDQALAARQKGNEGMARVCARRAAGWAVGEYFNRRGIPFSNPSAYERLKLLEQIPDTSSEIKRVAGHFILRINPEHELPVEADLIGEAVWLKTALLGESSEMDGQSSGRKLSD